MSDPRELAFSAIKNSLSQRGFLTIPAADNLSAADIPFVNMLCLTAVRNLTGIQLILKDFLRKNSRPKRAMPGIYCFWEQRNFCI